MAYSRKDYPILNNEFVNDPNSYGYAAIRAAFPAAHVREISQADYDALPSQGARDAYDADRGAWVTALATHFPTFEGYVHTPVSTADREIITGSELFEAIDGAEYAGLNDADKGRVQIVLGLGDNIRIGPGSRARAWLQSAFGGGPTATAVLALTEGQTQTRAEEIGISPKVYPALLERLVMENL